MEPNWFHIIWNSSKLFLQSAIPVSPITFKVTFNAISVTSLWSDTTGDICALSLNFNNNFFSPIINIEEEEKKVEWSEKGDIIGVTPGEIRCQYNTCKNVAQYTNACSIVHSTKPASTPVLGSHGAPVSIYPPTPPPTTQHGHTMPGRHMMDKGDSQCTH